MADGPRSRQGKIDALQQQLAFWRERLQIASNSCRSGALRERAASEIHALERMLDDLGRQPGGEP